MDTILVASYTAVSDFAVEEDEFCVPPVTSPCRAVGIERVDAETEFAGSGKRGRNEVAVGGFRNGEQPSRIVAPFATVAGCIDVDIRREYAQVVAEITSFKRNAYAENVQPDLLTVVNPFSSAPVSTPSMVEAAVVVAEVASFPSALETPLKLNPLPAST